MKDAPGGGAAKSAALRLVFSLDRDEDPRLFDDLVAMRKGVKRTARLRLLAHDGLLLQQGMVAQVATGQKPGQTAGGAGQVTHLPPDILTNQIFGPPADG